MRCAASYCAVGSSSLSVDPDCASVSLLLTGGLLVRVQPEEPPFQQLTAIEILNNLSHEPSGSKPECTGRGNLLSRGCCGECDFVDVRDLTRVPRRDTVAAHRASHEASRSQGR